MEAVCSLEDVARVLADNGYNLNDDSCFANTADLPSVLNALDSPDSFPESPCSDEDIVRVLDIARMPSPSLLDSCTSITHPFTSHPNNGHHTHHSHHHHHHLPSPTESPDTYDFPIQKTRDPCITNAVLQNPLLPNFHHQHTTREPNSLDLFSIAMNCSFHHDDGVSNLNSLAISKDINNNNNINSNHNDDAFKNYFNSSSALSPVSETDTILPLLPDTPSSSNAQTSHQSFLLYQSEITAGIESNTSLLHSIHPITQNVNPNLTNTIQIPTPSDPPTKANKTRKRRKKSSHVTPKPKRRKQQQQQQQQHQQQDNLLLIPKPKAPPRPKQGTKKGTKAARHHDNSSTNSNNTVEKVSKRKCTASSTSGSRTSKKSKTNNSSSLETIQECDSDTRTPFDTPSTANPELTTTEIGSTNGVVEDSKGLRRSSRSKKNVENYNFRLSSLVKRVETERKQKEPKQPKGKAKPPPLSKYRRRTANARERDRMKEINDAFDVLKNTLPDMEPEDGKNKITKFTILKLALNYISSLQDILDMDPEQPSSSNGSREHFSFPEESGSSDPGVFGQISNSDIKTQEDQEPMDHVSKMATQNATREPIISSGGDNANGYGEGCDTSFGPMKIDQVIQSDLV